MLAKDNINIDFEKIDLTDSNAYKILREGKNKGIFQFESPGIKDFLQQLSPDCFNDLMSLSALYRPGPLENIPTYIACKLQKKKPSYIHSSMEEILKDTYGVIIYQEQVMKIAMKLAKYSAGQSDILRRAMGKKIKSEMASQRQIFLQGAKENNIDQAEEIFKAIEKFAGYGFNKSHAVAYSILSYQTAYLKSNHTIYFYISILSLEINDKHKVALLIQEAKELKITTYPPDINNSDANFSKYDDKSIIFGLCAIRNIGVGIAQDIVDNRVKYGNFKDIFDLLHRLNGKITRKILESLVLSGAVDSIHSKTLA